jgi:hypothetical protein
MLGNWDPLIAISIFAPHWIIDRWSLGEKWLQLIRGRTIQRTLSLQGGDEKAFAIAFYAVVYTVVDNTLHILCLAGTIKFLII